MPAKRKSQHMLTEKKIKTTAASKEEFLMKMRKLDVFVEGSFRGDWCLAYNLNMLADTKF